MEEDEARKLAYTAAEAAAEAMLRDQIAMKAMEMLGPIPEGTGRNDKLRRANIALAAYRMADTMLSAREISQL